MGTYNESHHSMRCLRCGKEAEFHIQWQFGFTAMIATVSIGDEYPWDGNRMPHNGGRPEDGNCDGEGYTECPNCKKDFFVKAVVRGDQLVDIEPNSEKEPYVK